MLFCVFTCVDFLHSFEFLCFFALFDETFFIDENFLQNSCLFLLSFDEHVLHSFLGEKWILCCSRK